MHDHTLRDLANHSGVAFGTSGARGLVADMTDAVCYAYAKAFLQTIASDAQSVVLGHDLRPSSPRIATACIAAARDRGCHVIYAGALPTPALAYFAMQQRAPAIVITGSHIPFDRNGVKFYRADGEISKADEQAMLSTQVDVPTDLALPPLPAAEKAATQAYIRRYIDFFGAGALVGLTVAVYEHSSVGRDIIGEILRQLGATVVSLGRTDTFVPIDTEAVRPEDVAQARQWATEHRFDAIVSTDGDADRPLIGDELGQWLRGDVVGILCAHYLKAHTVVTPVSSNTALEKSNFFAKTLRTRIGSPYVIAEMESCVQAYGNSNLVVGYEANGGFLVANDVSNGKGNTLTALPTRDAVLPMLAALSSARQQSCPLSQLAKSLPTRYTASDRLQDFATEKSRLLLAELQSSPAYIGPLLAPDAGAVVEINTTDGLRVTFASGEIVHLRPSGNAPELRCYAEADSPEKAGLLHAQCLKRVQEKLKRH